MEKASDFRIIYVTTDSYENAINLANILVFEKLAACCSIVHGVMSVYEWQGEIHRRMEFQLIIKTMKDKLDAAESRINELHVDEVPEIIAVELDSGSKSYLDWMKKTLIHRY